MCEWTCPRQSKALQGLHSCAQTQPSQTCSAHQRQRCPSGQSSCGTDMRTVWPASCKACALVDMAHRSLCPPGTAARRRHPCTNSRATTRTAATPACCCLRSRYVCGCEDTLRHDASACHWHVRAPSEEHRGGSREMLARSVLPAQLSHRDAATSRNASVGKHRRAVRDQHAGAGLTHLRHGADHAKGVEH